MSDNQQPQTEKNPTLSDAEYIGYKMFYWSLRALAQLLKFAVMVIFPSLWLYRGKGNLWTRFTSGFWPILYAAYPILISVVLASLRPDFAALIGLTWLGIFGRELVFFAIMMFLVGGHRLAYFRLPGGNFLSSLGGSGGRHTEDNRASFQMDEVYKKK